MFDAAAALAAAAVYYLLPLVKAWLAGTGESRPEEPERQEPFLLPVALPRGPQSSQVERPAVGERLEALQTLWAYYVSIGMPQGEIEEILRPHLLHLVR